jgi:RimJ/RimL family protein N-acetyltransferase
MTSQSIKSMSPTPSVRISLDRVTATNSSAVLRLLTDPNAMRWLGPPWRDQPASPFVFAAALHNNRNRFWAVCVEGIPAGLIALSDIDLVDGIAMVWYVIDAEQRGRGIATLAINDVVRHAFDELNLATVYAWVMQDNVASSRVLEKNGFRPMGRMRQATLSNGQRVDRIYFDRTRQ